MYLGQHGVGMRQVHFTYTPFQWDKKPFQTFHSISKFAKISLGYFSTQYCIGSRDSQPNDTQHHGL